MLDHSFNPYEELVATQQEVVRLGEVCNQLIEAINAQAKLLEETAHLANEQSKATYNHTRKLQELNTTIAVVKNRVSTVEGTLKAR